ncbi:MAG: hypothetical protein E7608_04895 [Ruminococcaceae bacterium]|nr:hypothetical protein [Oscillospiraceae bacterium]
MFSMSVGAANVVGTCGVKNTIDDGLSVDAWNGSSEFSDLIILNISGIHHRYAVDVVFNGTLTFNTGSYIWDVNNLRYQTESSGMSDTEYSFQVVNYSDVPVGVEASITEVYNLLNTGDGVKLHFHTESVVSSDYTTAGTPDFSTTESTTATSIKGRLEGVDITDPLNSRYAPYLDFKAHLYIGESYDANADKDELWDLAVYALIRSTEDNKINLGRFTITISKVDFEDSDPGAEEIT